MAKSKSSGTPSKPSLSGKQGKGTKVEEIELDPDAWPKFEKLIRSAAKMGPMPHSSAPKRAK